MAEQQAGRPKVYTLAPHEAFGDAVARGVYALTDRDPLALARAQIFLPNRRSTRAMSEAFIRQSEARATLLPRMTPLGDIDEDEALGSFLDDLANTTDIPPSIGVVERQVELSRLVRAWLKTQGRADTPAANAAGRSANPEQSAAVQNRIVSPPGGGFPAFCGSRRRTSG